MKGMTLGLTRIVNEQYIDVNRMAKDGKIDRNIEGSPNGYYTCVIVPEHLKNRKVLIIPVADNCEMMTLEDSIKS